MEADWKSLGDHFVSFLGRQMLSNCHTVEIIFHLAPVNSA